MSKGKQQKISPSRTAAAVTAVVLGLCGIGDLLLFVLTAYVPVLLAGILQLLPAVLNLILMIPMGSSAEITEGNDETDPEAAPTDGQPVRKPTAGRFRRLLRAVCGLPRRGLCAIVHLRKKTHHNLRPALLVLATVGFNIYFWLSVRGGPESFVAEYYLPVIMLALFVLFIVLDKWCKHAGDGERGLVENEATLETELDADKAYDRALLHSLRGGLAAARLTYLVMIVALMIRLLGFTDLSAAVMVVISLLFVYETLFLMISLAVRVIRREMETAPELSIPMPGLGGEDLGILSYLEKNTGITMRSLWSIRLVKYVLPYAAMSVVVLLWGFSGVVKIEAHQQGAHYRLGVLQEETLQPGLHMTLPWPFDSVEVYDTEVANTMTVGYISTGSTDNVWTQAHGTEEHRLLLGGGSELVSVNLRLVYRIDDLKEYLSNNASPETLMQANAYDILTDMTIRTDLSTLLSTDRTVFADDLKTELSKRLEKYGTGLTVVDVVLESIHPPVEVADIYQQLLVAKIEAEQIKLAAESLAYRIRVSAEGNRYEIVGAAEREKASQIADAELEVAEFLAFVEAKENWTDKDENGNVISDYTYHYFRYLQAIAKAYGEGNCQIIIIGDGVNSSNIYIGNASLGGTEK